MLTTIYDRIKQFIVINYKFLISLVLIIVLFTYQTPYVVYKPGGLVSLNDRVDVKTGYDAKGDFSMTYVSLVKGTIPSLALSYIIPNWDIVAKKDITVDNKSINELFKLERIYLESSIDNATIVAYKKAGKKIDIKKYYNNVIFVADKAQTDVKVYDKIISVENEEVQNVAQIKDIVKNYHDKDKLEIVVNENNKVVTKHAIVYKDNDSLFLGIGSINTYDYDTNPKIEVKTKKTETGSSGGLMLTLAIYNKLIKEDITHGLKIAGTGTIDADGNVGEIDGVKYKLLGAYKKHVDVFLCPTKNYKEALKVKKDNKLKIEIKSVDTFDEALDYLQNM